MDVIIDDKELLKLYESGKSHKLKLTLMVIEKFFAVIQKIESAEDIYDLWNDKALNYEKLKGTDLFSLRLTGQYRLEVQITWKNKNQTIGEFTIIRISNHYN